MQSVSDAVSRFVWFELLTTDVEAAIPFYGKVVGWETEDFKFGPDAPPYRMFKVPGGLQIGGTYALPEAAKAMGAPPHWLGNLCVADCHAAAERVVPNGGSLLKPPFQVPNVGTVSIVADPGGAVFALFQPAESAPGHPGQPGDGEIAWSELYSTDLEKAGAFYEAVAGWKKADAMDMGPEMGTYQTYKTDAGRLIVGMMKVPPGMPTSAWGYYFHVGNLDGAIETAVSTGATLVNGPLPIPGGERVATLRDPQGAMFSLHGK